PGSVAANAVPERGPPRKAVGTRSRSSGPDPFPVPPQAARGSGAPGAGSLASPGNAPGFFAGRAVIDASSPRSPEASPQAAGVLDPAWWMSTPQTMDLMPVPAASILSRSRHLPQTVATSGPSSGARRSGLRIPLLRLMRAPEELLPPVRSLG